MKKSNRKLENNLRQMNKNKISKGRSKRSAKREVYSNTSLPQETGNISNKQPKFTFNGTRKRRTNRI